ncbi:MAG: DNA polymerase III subunit gamma/tau [Acidobacteria bacterium]|nr:DNA polymerase III subunit gamma/tau [Acidobacteriota bacterium]
MTYQAIARKYRPQTFEEVIGQEPIVRTLTNAIEKDQVSHAYIFSGTRGVGKTTTARILAKALNCQQGPTTKPCGQCPACTEITATTAVDVIEIDAASNRGIDEIRELRENVRYLPARDRFKVFIIDEAHMLTNEAFNALLKTLEEPPARVLFILATTEPHKIPSTIHSRCQSFHFRSIGFQEILDVLARVAKTEKAEVEKEALAVMARAAEGSLRDSLSILDQALAYCGTQVSADAVRELLGVVSRNVLEALVDAIREQSSEKILSLVDALVCDGHNLQHFCREALRHIRNLLVVRIGGSAAKLAEATGEEREKLAAAAQEFGEEDLLRLFNTLLYTHRELHQASQPRLHLELGLLKMVQAQRLVPLEEALAGLAGNPAPPASATPVRTPTAGRPQAAPSAPRLRSEAAPARIPKPAAPNLAGIESSTVNTIKTAVYDRSKLLGTFVDSVDRWESRDDTLQLWFTPENRSLPEMLDKQQKDQLEKIISEVLGRSVRVYAKVGTTDRAPATVGDKLPEVQELLKRFGGHLRTAAELPRVLPRRGSEKV